jgi:hypothetical protein
MQSRRRLVLAALLAACVGTAGFSNAADPKECSRSYEAVQRLRRDGKLREAEKEALVCAADACPQFLRVDCLTWLDETRKSLPSIAVAVVGRDGCDETAATVSVDGDVVATRLEGRAVPIDFGQHVVRVELADGAVEEQRIVLLEGEKNRRVAIRFAPADVRCNREAAGAKKAVSASSREEASRPTPSGPSTLVYALGGIGLASLAVGGTFGVIGFSRASSFDNCRPECTQHDVAGWHTQFLLADICTGVGLASIGLAAVLYWTATH